jgi:hypothetical protein
VNGVYKSLKGKVQDTLQMGKTSAEPLAREQLGDEAGLSQQFDDLEKAVSGGLVKLKEALKGTEAKRAEETRQARQVTGELKATIATLEAKLRDMDETIRKKDSSRQQIEETLKARVQELLNDTKGKDEGLAARAKEMNELKARLEAKTKEAGELAAACDKAKLEAATHAKQAQDLAVASRTQIEALQSQLKDRDALARRKDAVVRELEEKLASQKAEYEKLTIQHQELLAGRDATISDLKSQLRLLTKGIGEMSSFFKQAQAFTVVERSEPGAIPGGRGSFAANDKPSSGTREAAPQPTQARNGAATNTGSVAREPVAEQQAAAAKPQAGAPEINKTIKQTSGAPLRDDEVLSPEVLERVAEELAEVAGVMAPLANLILREHVESLGETMERFPKARVPDLLDSVANELLDEKRQAVFRKRLAQNVRIDV